MKERITIPNALTSLRILGALCLLFVQPLSAVFYVVYTFSGVSDVLDGWIARVTRSTSEFGAKLDSVADLLFYTVMLIRVFPLLWQQLPVWIWYWVAVILLLRLCSYGAAAVKYRRFAALHTYLNKLTGLMVFFLPYLLGRPWTVGYAAAICIIATLASLEELLLHLQSKTYQPERKSLFFPRPPVEKH